MRWSLIDDQKWKTIIPIRDSESCFRSKWRRLAVAPPVTQSNPVRSRDTATQKDGEEDEDDLDFIDDPVLNL